MGKMGNKFLFFPKEYLVPICFGNWFVLTTLDLLEWFFLQQNVSHDTFNQLYLGKFVGGGANDVLLSFANLLFLKWLWQS